MNENKKPTVALIFGGRGCEDRVSRRGRDHILPMIDKNTYSVREVFIDKDGRWLLDGVCEVFPFKGGFFSPKRNEMTPVDCAIPLLHGDFGEDGRVQGALDCADIPYIGCDSRVGALCRDKAVVKMIAATLDIPALPFLLLLRNEGMDYAVRRVEENLTYPVIIKPTALGSSVGVARVDKRENLRDELEKLFVLARTNLGEERVALHLDCANHCQNNDDRRKNDQSSERKYKIYYSFPEFRIHICTSKAGSDNFNNVILFFLCHFYIGRNAKPSCKNIFIYCLFFYADEITILKYRLHMHRFPNWTSFGI